ncbi:unnamed protein product, partial [Scytosiphon promiscuus]
MVMMMMPGGHHPRHQQQQQQHRPHHQQQQHPHPHPHQQRNLEERFRQVNISGAHSAKSSNGGWVPLSHLPIPPHGVPAGSLYPAGTAPQRRPEAPPPPPATAAAGQRTFLEQHHHARGGDVQLRPSPSGAGAAPSYRVGGAGAEHRWPTTMLAVVPSSAG